MITILELAEHILGRKASNGADFAEAGLDIMGGCVGCRASIAAYNAYPTKGGYWACKDCIYPSGDEYAGRAGFGTVEEAYAYIFPLREHVDDICSEMEKVLAGIEEKLDNSYALPQWMEDYHKQMKAKVADLRSALEKRGVS